MKSKLREKDVERLLKGAETIIISTDNGIGIEGKLVSTLGNFSMIVHQLVDGGCPKEYLKTAFELGLEDSSDKENQNEEKDKLREMLTDVLIELRDNINSLFGDDKDE